MQKVRDIYFYKDYFFKFYYSQDVKTKTKIKYVLDIIRYERIVPNKFLKYLKGTEGLYEVRITGKKGQIRVIGFFDKGDMVVLLNSFYKKTKKTPKKEIRLANYLKEDYYRYKNENK